MQSLTQKLVRQFLPFTSSTRSLNLRKAWSSSCNRIRPNRKKIVRKIMPSCLECWEHQKMDQPGASAHVVEVGKGRLDDTALQTLGRNLCAARRRRASATGSLRRGPAASATRQDGEKTRAACTLVPWVRVTRVFPTLRVENMDGALMSYQSFLAKGSELRKAILRESQTLCACHGVQPPETKPGLPPRGERNPRLAGASRAELRRAAGLTSSSCHPSCPWKCACSCCGNKWRARRICFSTHEPKRDCISNHSNSERGIAQLLEAPDSCAAAGAIQITQSSAPPFSVARAHAPDSHDCWQVRRPPRAPASKEGEPGRPARAPPQSPGGC